MGVPVRIDAARHRHNKIMVLDDATVITGSFNFTKSAEQSNAENLLVIRSAELAGIYAGNWLATPTTPSVTPAGRKSYSGTHRATEERPIRTPPSPPERRATWPPGTPRYFTGPTADQRPRSPQKTRCATPAATQPCRPARNRAKSASLERSWLPPMANSGHRGRRECAGPGTVCGIARRAAVKRLPRYFWRLVLIPLRSRHSAGDTCRASPTGPGTTLSKRM